MKKAGGNDGKRNDKMRKDRNQSEGSVRNWGGMKYHRWEIYMYPRK